ncbi:MAG: thioredoxin family protein [Thaumarchaeota archaeon S13]|nr:MAG: thioredoxin family protein [Thaumarchaeota archaeon S13]
MALLESQRSLKAGDAAPGFDLMGIDGRRHALPEYAGREGLLVIFMCNHCPYVKAKIDAIKAVHERFGDRVAVVGINSNDAVAYPDDSYEAMKAMAAERGIAFDYLVDETQEVARRYGATCTPDPFLFDSSMRLAFHGRIDDAMGPEETPTERVMEAKIAAMLEGRPLGADFDPSRGCSIKWRQN